MYKELVISIIIIVLILGLNYITNNYTSYTVSEVSKYLDNTRQDLEKEEPDYETAYKKADDTLYKWEELDDKLALYIEHDEIEKVKTAIISMKSFIQAKDDSQAIDSIDRCKYILEHIEKREKFTIDNIF